MHLNLIRKRFSIYVKIIITASIAVYLMSNIGNIITNTLSVNEAVTTRYKIHAIGKSGEKIKGTSQMGFSQKLFIDQLLLGFKRDSDLFGKLNVHRWFSVCGNTIDSLRRYTLFPKHPQLRTYISVTKMRTRLNDFGDRIFGYLHPALSGLYQFAVAADDFAEVWLSSDTSPNNTRLICQVGGLIKGKYIQGYTGFNDFTKYDSQLSENIFMEGGQKYFVEILYKQGDGYSHLQVAWKIPGVDKFMTISSDFISPFAREDNTHSSTLHESHKKLSVLVLSHHKHPNSQYTNPAPYRRYTVINKTIVSLPLFRKAQENLALCRFHWKVKKTLKRYQGIRLSLHPSIYPYDGSGHVIQICHDAKYSTACKGNTVLENEEAIRVARKYLNSTSLMNHSLKSIVRVEEAKKGRSRYFFLELVLEHEQRLVRIADHVVYDTDSFSFCKPSLNTWNPDVTIYIIITVKNQGVWLRHFVDNMAAIRRMAEERNFHPIIVDFESKDINTEDYLKSSGLEKYTVLRMKGAFHKTSAINRAAETVKDDNSIIFQLDLHLDIPLNLMTLVRKHTIQGYMAFVPLLTRLSCGSSPDFPKGAWEDHGYGLFATYKSDWVRFGGMNEREFLNRWGGEDWEMVDRVIMHGIIIQRIKVPGLFHYYHTKDRMWEKAA